MGAFVWRGNTVGTLRFVPMEQGLTRLEALLARQGVDPRLIAGGWEFGRLVLNPEYRGGPEIVKRCIFLGVRYLAHVSGATDVFASCTPALARLYRRYGFRVVDSVPGDGSAGAYSLIHGTVAQILAASAGDEFPSCQRRYSAASDRSSLALEGV